MLISCWSAKGGVGTTVVAAALAVRLARREPGGVLAVDLAGDLPAALGCREPAGPALVDWLAAGDDVPTDAMARLEHEVSPGLALIPRGDGPLPSARGALLARMLAAEPRVVIADCGRIDPAPPVESCPVPADDGGTDRPLTDSTARIVTRAGSSSLLVIRPCYLALRRATALDVQPTGIVLVVEDGRAITPVDVESVLKCPVVARVRVSPAVARAVDAGLLASTLPRGLDRDLANAA
jgi:hypothetical protein